MSPLFLRGIFEIPLKNGEAGVAFRNYDYYVNCYGIINP